MKEQDVISLLRSGDAQGAAELLRHYGALMRYIIAPILPDLHDQEDCLAETVAKVWEKIDSFDPEKGRFRPWLTAVTRNCALNRARADKKELSLEELPGDTPSPLPTPEEAVLRRERQERLLAALNKLDQKDQLIFYRKYYYLQSTAQIAAEMGLTCRGVEGRLYRIKQKLRVWLGGDEDA